MKQCFRVLWFQAWATYSWGFRLEGEDLECRVQHKGTLACFSYCEPQQHYVFEDPVCIFQLQHDCTMTLGGAGSQEVDWDALFLKEAATHFRKSIAAMEDEIYGKFRLRLGNDITMSNY